MDYNTLDGLTEALEHSARDMLVVLMPGNETAAIWPPGHPEGWSETHPRVFRVPAGMNGTTREFLREELNARNGWAVTGDEKESPEEWYDFALQAELALEPKEGLHHQVWVQLKRVGECTSARMSELTGRDKPQCRRALSRLHKSGNVKRWFLDDRTAVYEAADKEPPFEAKPNQNDREATAQIYRDMHTIMEFLGEGQLTANGLADLSGMTRTRVSSILNRMKNMGAVRCIKVSPYHYWEIKE